MPTTCAAAPRACARPASLVASRPIAPYVVFIAVPNGPISSALRRKFAGLETAAVGTTAAASDGASEESSERPCSGLSARPLRSSQRPIQPTWPASLRSPTS